MQASEKGLNLIKKFEGLRLEAYKPVPSEKMYTIGWGHYGVSKGMKITQKQAEEYLRQDVIKMEKEVNALERPFNQNEFDALVSFTFNCGAANLKTLCRNRNTAQIADAFLKYCYAGGKILEGLKKRRQEERDLFLTPVIQEKLPYDVVTNTVMNIRSGAGTQYGKIRTAQKGERLTVWAVETNTKKWGRNGKEYFCLDYCTKVI